MKNQILYKVALDSELNLALFGNNQNITLFIMKLSQVNGKSHWNKSSWQRIH